MKQVVILLILAAILLAFVAASLQHPYAGFQDQVFVDIPRGTGTMGVADRLFKAGVIQYRWQYLAVRALRPRARVQAGEYLFKHPSTPWEVFDRMVRGDIFSYEFRVIEGQNMYDIADSLEKLGVIGRDKFLAAARDPSLIRSLTSDAPTLEGYLFPDTYRLTRHTTAQDLCRMMTERFRDTWAGLGTTLQPHGVVTLASLVEKETGIADERPMIASVYQNRLRIGMKLDCDPTAIYAALREDRYRGTLYHDDLTSGSPYNTYQHAGLPPGPIANPGRESLKAALNPAQSPYLYFVARPDGSGRHSFSQDFEAHQRAVRQYRRGIEKRNEAVTARTVDTRKPARKNR